MDKPWLKSYPEGTAAEIDVNEFQSVAEVFEPSWVYLSRRPALDSEAFSMACFAAV